MTNKPFRVLLDLTDIHIESLKYVWINVSPEDLKTIADFKTSVVHKINLKKIDIKLFVRNGLLLDDETVMILREDDIVKVQYEDQHYSDCNYAEYSVKESKKSSKKRNRSDSHCDMFLSAKKCKADSKILTQENEKIHFDEVSKKKKKKHEQIHSVFSGNSFNESPTLEPVNHKAGRIGKKKDEKKIPLEMNITDCNFQQKCDSFFSFDDKDNKIEKNNTSKTDINMESSSCLKLNSANDSFPINDFSLEQELGLKELLNTEITKKSGGLGNNCPKKKRKRHRKRKRVLETVIDACDNTDEFKSFVTETNENIHRKHIIYSSSPSKEQAVMQLDCTNKTEKVKNLTKDYFVMDKSVSNESLEASNYHPKVSTPAQSNCENPNLHMSVMQKTNISSNCVKNHETVGFKRRKNKTYAESADEQNVSLESSKNNEKPLDLCYTDLPSLNYRPDIGTHIAYKTLELDEHYSPVISDYRVGIVKRINLDNEEMEIELLKHEIKSGRTGKFENLKEGEIPLPEVKTCDIVRWSALVEPKLFID